MKKDMRKQIRHLSEAHEKIRDNYLDDSKFAFGHNTLAWDLAEKKSAIKVYLILLGSYYYYYYMPTDCPPGKKRKEYLKNQDHKHTVTIHSLTHSEACSYSAGTTRKSRESFGEEKTMKVNRLRR